MSYATRCRGCGYGWSKDCDNPTGPCGCGAWHHHDPLVKHRCRANEEVRDDQ